MSSEIYYLKSSDELRRSEKELKVNNKTAIDHEEQKTLRDRHKEMIN